VSQTIRKLEDELGEALFDRSSREGVLTDAGKVLFEYAEKLINLRGEAAESLTELRELQKGKLVIAANEFTVLYLLPLLAEFRRLHPMIKIKVERALGSHIPDDVLSYNAEFGVLSYEPQDASLISVVVYLDELVFVVSASSYRWCRVYLAREKVAAFKRQTPPRTPTPKSVSPRSAEPRSLENWRNSGARI
jgi:DNA-binding transcriptional LysR family regulator